MALQQVYMGKESDKRCGRLASSLTEFDIILAVQRVTHLEYNKHR